MLARLTVAEDGTARGHFLDYPGLFMTLRHTPQRVTRPAELPQTWTTLGQPPPTTLGPAGGVRSTQ